MAHTCARRLVAARHSGGHSRVPAAQRIGEENRGWYVGATTLDFERSNISRSIHARKALAKLARYAAENQTPRAQRLELADRAIETAVCELLSFVVVSIQAKGGVPNMEASMCKMFGSELAQRIARTELQSPA